MQLFVVPKSIPQALVFATAVPSGWSVPWVCIDSGGCDDARAQEGPVRPTVALLEYAVNPNIEAAAGRGFPDVFGDAKIGTIGPGPDVGDGSPPCSGEEGACHPCDE
jgi:hypothetical protein